MFSKRRVKIPIPATAEDIPKKVLFAFNKLTQGRFVKDIKLFFFTANIYENVIVMIVFTLDIFFSVCLIVFYVKEGSWFLHMKGKQLYRSTTKCVIFAQIYIYNTLTRLILI